MVVKEVVFIDKYGNLIFRRRHWRTKRQVLRKVRWY